MFNRSRAAQSLADDISFIREMDRFRLESKLPDSPALNNHKRRLRARLQDCKDYLAKSISEDWRERISKDGESLTKYIIFEDTGETDEEIMEYINDIRLYNCSPYDCTGRLFTRFIHWSRQPAGIVVIHELGLDV